MSFQHTGSQFDENIDPRLLDISAQQLGFTIDQTQLTSPTSNPLIQDFNRDLDDVFQTPTPRDQWQNTLPITPATPGNVDTLPAHFESNALPIRQQAIPVTPPSTIRTGPTLQHPRVREIQGRLQQYGSSSYSAGAGASSTLDWRIDNPYALLASGVDISDIVKNPPTHNVSMTSMPSGHFHQPQFVPRLEPSPVIENNMWHRSMDQSPRVGNRQTLNDQSNTVSMQKLPMIPFNSPSEEALGRWNRDTFHLVGSIPPHNLRPSTPASTKAHRRRTSRASSTVSTSTYAPTFGCDKCHKVFEKRHQLNHHYRWHDDPMNTCEECGKKFVAKKDLRRHKKIHNKEERHIFCNSIGCKYQHVGFQRQDHLKRHMERKHGAAL